MKLGILIIFSYGKELPGAVQDIYHAATYLLKICDKITIFTDVKEDEDIRIMSQNFNMGLVKADAIQIINNFHKQKLIQIIRTSRQLLDGLIHIVDKKIKQIFLYYSGHSINGQIIGPDQSKVEFTTLLEIFTSRTLSTTQIFIVLDACYANGMNLRYQLDDRGHYFLIPEGNKINHKVICVSSTTDSQRSLSSSFGSIFTRYFFENLSGNNRDLGKLVAHVTGKCQLSNDQNVCVHASFPDLTKLWSWIYGSEIDISINSIIIVNINNSPSHPRKSINLSVIT